MKLARLLLWASAAGLALTSSTLATEESLLGDHRVEADPGASPAEAGNLTVEGSLFVDGNEMQLGATGALDPALRITYVEGGTTYELFLTADRDAAAYLWRDNGGGTAQNKMKLDGNNVLSLYNSAGTAAGITLNPNTGDINLSSGGAFVLSDGKRIGTKADLSTLYDASGNAKISINGSGALVVSGSAAFGSDTSATGARATAFGYNTIASGEDSAAFGFYTTASGFSAFAFGNQAIASGHLSMAWGEFSSATATYSTAFGSETAANGIASTAFGLDTTASGDGATAFGLLASASGVFATAWGEFTQAQAAGSVAFGRYNVGGFTNNNDGNPDNDGDKNWIPSDPILEIGNGDYQTRRNALTIRKDGEMRVEGLIQSKTGFRTPARGDLSMGEFEEGEDPADLNPTTGLKYPGE